MTGSILQVYPQWEEASHKLGVLRLSNGASVEEFCPCFPSVSFEDADKIIVHNVIAYGHKDQLIPEASVMETLKQMVKERSAGKDGGWRRRN